MQPRRAARLFSNDDAELDLGGRPAKRARKAAAATAPEEANSGDDGDGSDGEYEDLADALSRSRGSKKGRATKDEDMETDGEGGSYVWISVSGGFCLNGVQSAEAVAAFLTADMQLVSY